MTATPAPGFRIERTGNLYVYHPIKPTTDKGVTK